jgi:hypothetical protein
LREELLDNGSDASGGLGAIGEASATETSQLLHEELEVPSPLCGPTAIRNVDRAILVPRSCLQA